MSDAAAHRHVRAGARLVINSCRGSVSGHPEGRREKGERGVGLHRAEKRLRSSAGAIFPRRDPAPFVLSVRVKGVKRASE